jgi:proteasome accessory factor B
VLGTTAPAPSPTLSRVEKVDRLERLTNLVLVLLDTRRPLTLREIADTVGGYPEGHQACRQAFERDKRTLREEGVPISVEAVDTGGQLGYRIRPEDYYLPELDLTADEQVALNLAVAGVHLDDASGREALLKLGVIGGDRSSPVAALPALPALPRLHDAIRQRAAVRFDYHSAPRQVDPYGLLFRSGFWYLVGWDHGREALRTFRVDRMGGPPTLGEGGSFELPAGFDPSSEVPAEPWRIGEGDTVRAEVRIDTVQAPAVVAELGEEAVLSRGEDGSVVVGLDVANEVAFRSWLLGLLDHAEVLGPAGLREEVVAWLEAIAGRAGARV